MMTTGRYAGGLFGFGLLFLLIIAYIFDFKCDTPGEVFGCEIPDNAMSGVVLAGLMVALSLPLSISAIFQRVQRTQTRALFIFHLLFAVLALVFWYLILTHKIEDISFLAAVVAFCAALAILLALGNEARFKTTLLFAFSAIPCAVVVAGQIQHHW